MLTALRALWIAALLCAFAGPAQADSWVAPQVREVFSASRDHFVRVIPGKSVGDTIGFAGAAKGAYAAAEYYQRQPDRSYRLTATATLLNPVAPVDIFVTNDLDTGGLVSNSDGVADTIFTRAIRSRTIHRFGLVAIPYPGSTLAQAPTGQAPCGRGRLSRRGGLPLGQ